jgi:excisionase family DNA binding protein
MKKHTSPRRDFSAQKFLTVAEAAEYLSIPTPAALHQRIQRKVIPSWTWTRLGREYRFLRVALDEWLEEKYRAARRKGKAA